MSENKNASSAGGLSRTKTALYGLANLPTSIVGLPIALYIPAFYSQNLGLSLATVGLLIAMSRLTDVVTDPAIGIASDRWTSRFGRRKPWIVAGMPLMMMSLWMLFVPDSAFAVNLWAAIGGETINNLYLFVWVSALYLSFTLVDLPYKAWGAELSTDYDERSRITGWRETFGYGGLLMALSIPLVMSLVFALPGANNALYAIAVVVLVLLPLLTAPAILWVKEPPPRTKVDKVPWRRGLKIIWANGPYRRLVISLLFMVIAVNMTATLSFFFVSTVMEQPFDRYAFFILAYYLSSSLAIPIWFSISRRIGKHRTVVLGIFWLSLWSAFIPLLGPDQFWLFVVIMLLKGSAVGALVFLPASMAADVVDLDTLRTGEQRTGLYFSLWGMVNKAAVALGVLLATTGVTLFGFDPSLAENTATAKMSVAILYSIVPAVLACIALPLLWKYPLSKERQERMRAHIQRRDSRRLDVSTALKDIKPTRYASISPSPVSDQHSA
ncbi:MAG: GPH family glycoside/pentoside/hexuronide:cation symporter [Paraglaciecola psychrophila]